MGQNDGGEIRVLGLDHQSDGVEIKRRAGYVSPELNFEVWGRVGRAIRFVRGFYPNWDDAYCAQLMRSFRTGRQRPHRLAFVRRENKIEFAAGTRAPARTFDSR